MLIPGTGGTINKVGISPSLHLDNVQYYQPRPGMWPFKGKKSEKPEKDDKSKNDVKNNNKEKKKEKEKKERLTNETKLMVK